MNLLYSIVAMLILAALYWEAGQRRSPLAYLLFFALVISIGVTFFQGLKLLQRLL